MTFLTHRVIWVTQLSQCLILMERFWGNIRHWLNCHCLTEYIRLFFIFEKLGFISRTSPEGHYPEVRERYEEDGDWFLTMADFMYFFFFKQNITFLLSPLSSASFNDINGQMDLGKSLGWLREYLGVWCSSPWKLRAGSSVVPALCKHVVWWEILICEELTGCFGGKDTTSSLTNTCLVNKGQVKGPWDYMDYSCWLHRLARQLKAAGIINILPRGAAIALQAERSCSNCKLVLP